eukprot:EG_transcript_13321
MPCAQTLWLAGLLCCVLLGTWFFSERWLAAPTVTPVARPVFRPPRRLPPAGPSTTPHTQPMRVSKAQHQSASNLVAPRLGRLPQPVCPEAPHPGRYLFYRSEGCPGLLHKLASLRCAAEEARRLGRILILEPICVAPAHNRNLTGPSGEGLEMEPATLLDLRDVPHLPSRCLPGGRVDPATMTAVRGDIPTGRVAKSPVKYLMRTGFSQRAGFWWYSVCDHYERKPKPLPWSPTVLEAANRMAAVLGPGFVFVHVRRGDMVGRWRVCWPRLDADTQAGAIGTKLHGWFPANTTLYVASNEWRPQFFLPLKTAFRVFTADDFQGAVLRFAAGNNYLLFAVEQALSLRAAATVETFREVAQGAGTPYYLARDLRYSVQCGMAPPTTKRKAKGARGP